MDQTIIAVANVVSAAAIIVLIWQVFLTKTQVKAAQDQVKVAQDQVKVAQDQAKLAQDQVEVTQQQLKTAQAQAIEELKEAHDDHDRSRREKAIDILLTWAQNVKEEGFDALRLCLVFNESQINDFYKYKESQPEILIEARYRKILDLALSKFTGTTGTPLKQDGQYITLEKEAILYLRWNFVSYMNLTEAVISAWTHNTADRTMIQEQFKFLYDSERSVNLIANINKASTSGFPSLDVFIDLMYKKTIDERRQISAQYKIELDKNFGRLGGDHAESLGQS